MYTWSFRWVYFLTWKLASQALQVVICIKQAFYEFQKV